MNNQQVDRLQAYWQAMTMAQRENIPFEHQLEKLDWQHNSAVLRNVVWQAATVSNLTIELDFAVLTELSGIYNGQNLYNEYAAGLLKNFSQLSVRLVVDEDKRQAILIHSRDIEFGLALLNDLNTSYQQFLKAQKQN